MRSTPFAIGLATFGLLNAAPLCVAQSMSVHPVGPTPQLATPQRRPCAPQALSTPQWRNAQPLSSSGVCSTTAWPYCARYSPRGDRLYVSLFGGLVGAGGCRVQRLDPVSFAVLAQIPTGESPQDLAFVTHSDGSVRLGFVANGSASTVTVFDEHDSVVATVPIPFAPGGFFPTAFPNGLAVSPSQTHVHVSTMDGGGWVYAIDVATLQLDPARAIQLGPDHSAARLVFAGNRLAIAASQALPNWIGSTAKVMLVDPAHPHVVRELALATASDGQHFPSVQDCSVDCDGMLWVAGYDMGARVFGIDPRTLTLRHVIPTRTSQPDGKFQALGLSVEGLLVVADVWTDELSVIDARRRVWGATLDLTALPTLQRAAQELEFSPSGRTLLAPFAATDNLGVFDL